MFEAWRRERFWLLVGDLVALLAGLWLALLFREFEWPRLQLVWNHLQPFSIIFVFWLLIFYISDFYRRSVIVFMKRMVSALIGAAAAGTFLAVVFLYLALPALSLAPKTVLFLDLVLTWLLLGVWRLWLAPRLVAPSPIKVAFFCQGEAVSQLIQEFRRNPRYGFLVVEAANLDEAVRSGVSLAVVNIYDDGRRYPGGELYRAVFAGLTVVHLHHLYEEVFNCVPLWSINERWFLEHFSNQPRPWYQSGKRVIDLLIAGPTALLSLIAYPFVFLAIYLDDGRPFFFAQERIGRGGRVFKIYKFRSMRNGRVTRAGRVLRRSRLDELPQLWSVVRGELSLIGPRPERPEYAAIYRREIPFYDARHLIEPGLSGWAQIYHANHPHFSPSSQATAEKLAHDLYYIKNRGLTLDLVIVLKTVKTLLAHRGA